MTSRLPHLLCAALALVLSATVRAETVQVAVAANFTAPMKAIAADFEKDTGNTVQLSFGATGKFYAQIKNGAPFEVFLAADDATPPSWKPKATPCPAAASPTPSASWSLWSAKAGLVDAQGDVLKKNEFSTSRDRRTRSSRPMARRPSRC